MRAESSLRPPVSRADGRDRFAATAPKHRVAAPIAAALLDAFPENFGMLWMLYQPGDLPSIWVSGAVAVAAWLKWLLLILVFLLLLGAVIVSMLRARRLDAKHLAESSENPPQAVSPGYLLHLELDHISRNRPKHIVPRSQTDSPHDDRAAWRRAYESDLFGLALSGGGIRSATFALGVLQALAKRGLLSKIDYLSTVSGGGATKRCSPPS